MKTPLLCLLIALGVAGVLYCRVNLGMSWAAMNAVIEDLIPRVAAIGVVLLGAMVTLVYFTKLDRTKYSEVIETNAS